MKAKQWLKQKGIHPTEPIYWDTGEKNIYLDELMDEFVSSQLEPLVSNDFGGMLAQILEELKKLNETMEYIYKQNR